MYLFAYVLPSFRATSWCINIMLWNDLINCQQTILIHHLIQPIIRSTAGHRPLLTMRVVWAVVPTGALYRFGNSHTSLYYVAVVFRFHHVIFLHRKAGGNFELIFARYLEKLSGASPASNAIVERRLGKPLVYQGLISPEYLW